MTDFDRYRRVGLLTNPFAAGGFDDKFEPETGPWFVDRGLAPPPPPGSNMVVQVIGDQGLGKSTQLAEWRRLQAGPLHYIPRRPYRDRRRAAPIGPIVYGDEIDRMPIRLRARWFRRLATVGATVVLGTHRDLSRVARRAGFADVRTHRLEPATRAELAVVLERRLLAAAVPDRELSVGLTDVDVEMVFNESSGNLRAADSVGHRILAERVRQVADRV